MMAIEMAIVLLINIHKLFIKFHQEKKWNEIHCTGYVNLCFIIFLLPHRCPQSSLATLSVIPSKSWNIFLVSAPSKYCATYRFNARSTLCDTISNPLVTCTNTTLCGLPSSLWCSTIVCRLKGFCKAFIYFSKTT